MRNRNWKLVSMRGEPLQLFDLAADVGEKNDLASQKPEVIKVARASGLRLIRLIP